MVDARHRLLKAAHDIGPNPGRAAAECMIARDSEDVCCCTPFVSDRANLRQHVLPRRNKFRRWRATLISLLRKYPTQIQDVVETVSSDWQGAVGWKARSRSAKIRKQFDLAARQAPGKSVLPSAVRS